MSDYVLYDEAGIFERTGVTPAQYPEYAALRGDPSDNLPGVPGIGEKTAAKLITTYGNLEGIFEHLDELPPKQRQNLGEARERVFLNREMSRLRLDCDVELDVAPADLRMGAWDREEVRVLFDQLAFRTLLPRLLDAVGDAAAAPESATLEVDTVVLRDPAAGRRVASGHRRGGATHSKPRWDGAPVASALRAVVFGDADGRDVVVDRRCSRDDPSVAALAGLVDVGGPPLVAHRAKELMHGLDADVRFAAPRHRGDGVPARPRRGEVPARRSRAAFPRHRGRSPPTRGRARSTSTAKPRSTTLRARRACRLAVALGTALDARELTDLYERFELPLVRVLARMEDERHPHRPRVPRDPARRSRRSSATRSCSGSTRTRARSST